jgi:hypothetical protein
VADASYLALRTDLRYVVDNIPAESGPGRRFDYNNVNFQALGFVLESATGRRYPDYLSEKLWQPIDAGEAALWLDRDGGSARTFGYLFATASDWGRVGQLLLQEGEWDGKTVISRDYLREMLKPSPSEPTYGMGIWLANDDHQWREREPPFLVRGIFYLDGRYKQRVYVIPSHDIVIVRVGENARGWEESALPNAVMKDAAGESGNLPGKPMTQPPPHTNATLPDRCVACCDQGSVAPTVTPAATEATVGMGRRRRSRGRSSGAPTVWRRLPRSTARGCRALTGPGRGEGRRRIDRPDPWPAASGRRPRGPGARRGASPMGGRRPRSGARRARPVGLGPGRESGQSAGNRRHRPGCRGRSPARHSSRPVPVRGSCRPGYRVCPLPG